MILTHTLTYNNQRIEIVVYYDSNSNVVEEIKNIWLFSYGKMTKVTDLFLEFFERDLNRIIECVDWKEAYRNAMNAAA